MAAAMDGHSRAVAWLKIVLPLLALAILSTIFLVARRIDPSQTIPYADSGGLDLAGGERMGLPSYSGVTSGGAAVSLDAESARPGENPEDLAVRAPKARLDLPEGRTVTIAAAEGLLDRQAGMATLSGPVIIDSSDGYRIKAGGVTADLAAGRVETRGGVEGTAPFGTLVAGRLLLEPDAAGDHVLSFDGGVKLVYLPGR